MGTDESDSMAQGSSSMPESDNMVQGSEQEKELREVLGGLRSGEGRCGVPENGGGFSSIENQGLGDDDGVVEVVKSDSSSSVLETNVSVLGENDGQVLTDSEVNGVSSWLEMQESDVSTVFSSDGAEKLDYVYASEKLDYMFASESRVAEAAVLSVDGSVGVGGEDARDGGKSEEVGKYEDCDGDGVTIAPEGGVAEAAVFSVDSSVGVDGVDRRDGGKSEEEGKCEDCDGDDVTIAPESGVAEAAVFSVDSLVGVDGEDGRDGGKNEEEGNDKDCDRNVVAISSESGVAETAILSVDSLVGVVGEDRRDGGKIEEEGKDEDIDGNILTIASESRVAEAAVMSVDSAVGVGGEDGQDGGKSEEEGKDKDCDGNVTINSESIAEDAVLSVDRLVGVGGEDGRDGGKSEEEVKNEDCNGNIENIASENRVAEAAVLSVDGLVGVGGEDRRDGEKSEGVEKDEGCDGHIVTIEVPIAETSENMDVEVEDLSDEGHGFAVGDFVWGQIESHPWWPGRVYDPSDASHFALKLKQQNRLLVSYFGDETFAWCHPSQLKPFKDNFDDMVKQSSSIAFVNAVQEAVNEVGRLLYMKMSHPFVAKKTGSESTLPLAKNPGIKEGVLVPGILLDVPIEPAELLSYVKRIAESVDIASILELEILKAQLAAFYLSKGVYKLPDYMDPQPVAAVEDSLMDETVAVDNSNSTVEALTQGPFDELVHSPGLSGNISNHVRKQKSIAEIMGEDKDATDEVVNAIGSNGGKKRKGCRDGMASKPLQKKRELPLDTDGDVSSAESDGSGGKENSNIGTLMQSKEKKEAFGNENTGGGSQKETNEGRSEEQNEKGHSSRERKKSKYLSPPFTTSTRGQREGNVETESLKLSRKAKVSQRRAGAAGLHSLPVYKGRLFDSSNYQTLEDDGKKTIDPKKIQAPGEEVLSQVHCAAISPQIRRQGASLEQFVDFTYVFRSSLYCQGSLREVYQKSQPERKRKKSESEHGMLEDLNLSDDHISALKQNSGPKKRRKETAPSMPKLKRTPETNTGSKKGTDENAPGALLFVSFWPGSSLPSRSDLFSVYSKFGALNEEETDMFRTNYTARVSFLRACDAENAFNHSQNNNPFGSCDVTFQLQYLSDESKSGQHVERSKRKPSPAATPSVSLSQGSEASKLIFIQQKLQGLTILLEASGGKFPDMMAKLEGEMKALLEDVNKMVEASLF
ncbi:Serine/threonine-protein kinase ATM [Spatholobus suberectus]|nr:Serine/threonine-protein kinase ATM [Spatholobus suberectus]